MKPMLIAHYFDKDFAAAASKKAFITNRIGDLGFILGIALCLHLYGKHEARPGRKMGHVTRLKPRGHG